MNLQAILQFEVDGHPALGSPFFQALELTQGQTFNVQIPVTAVGVYTTIPTLDAITDITVLLLSNPDAELVYRFQAQTDEGLVVPAGGLILISGALIDAGAGTNVLVSNSSLGGVATIIGFAGG